MTEDNDEFDAEPVEIPEDAECTEVVGVYDSFEAFARQALECLVIVDGMWLLDCLQWERVASAMACDGLYRYRVDGERLLRDTLRQVSADARVTG